jgi:hypothetical protein
MARHHPEMGGAGKDSESSARQADEVTGHPSAAQLEELDCLVRSDDVKVVPVMDVLV